jgi:hypothetical membrane protein
MTYFFGKKADKPSGHYRSMTTLQRLKRQPENAAGGLLLGAGLLFGSTELTCALQWEEPRYSYMRNYISDLGVAGKVWQEGEWIHSPTSSIFDSGVMLSSLLSVLAAVALVLAVTGTLKDTRWAEKTFLALIAISFIGCVLIVSFDAPLSAIHLIGAFACIGGGGLATIFGSLWILPKIWGGRVKVLAGMGVVGLVAMQAVAAAQLGVWVPSLGIGALERAAVYSIAAWQLMVGLGLLLGGRKKSSFIS